MDEKLTDVEGHTLTYRELLVRIDERQNRMVEDIAQMKTKLFGNGKEGLCDSIIRHEDELKDIRSDAQRIKDDRKWICGVSLTVIITAIAVFNYFHI
jgi:hypothetical protein